jgi:hypothetical protein
MPTVLVLEVGFETAGAPITSASQCRKQSLSALQSQRGPQEITDTAAMLPLEETGRIFEPC